MSVIWCLLVEVLTSVEDLRYSWEYWILRLITVAGVTSLSDKRIPLCLGPQSFPIVSIGHPIQLVTNSCSQWAPGSKNFSGGTLWWSAAISRGGVSRRIRKLSFAFLPFLFISVLFLLPLSVPRLSDETTHTTKNTTNQSKPKKITSIESMIIVFTCYRCCVFTFPRVLLYCLRR